jgi:hypothetical protein
VDTYPPKGVEGYPPKGVHNNTYINNNTNNIDRGLSKKFIKPKLEELKNYCLERKNNVLPEKFLDFYESNGRMV